MAAAQSKNIDAPGTLLDRRRASAHQLALLFGAPCCARCGYPFAVDPPHSVSLTRNKRIGFFFLCETCWRMTTVPERLDYLRAVYVHQWTNDHTHDAGIPLEEYEGAVCASAL